VEWSRPDSNHYTATAGANVREPMERLGRNTARAAMIYLHSNDPRQRAPADEVDKAIRAELRKARKLRPERASNARPTLPRRHSRDVARHRGVWPDVGATSRESGWT